MRAVYSEIMRGVSRKPFSFERFNTFQENLSRGLPNDWHCRAGSRYLYVCEDGLVHWCSQQRGYPGIPLQDYTPDHLAREYRSEKPCAPFCTISCVHRVSVLDSFREDPHGSLQRFFPPRPGTTEPDLPAPVRLLKWLFLPQAGSRRPLLGRAALRLLRVCTRGL